MEEPLRIVGEYGRYQSHIKIILLGCAFLSNIFSLQIDLMLKLPNIKIIHKNISISNNITNIKKYKINNDILAKTYQE